MNTFTSRHEWTLRPASCYTFVKSKIIDQYLDTLLLLMCIGRILQLCGRAHSRRWNAKHLLEPEAAGCLRAGVGRKKIPTAVWCARAGSYRFPLDPEKYREKNRFSRLRNVCRSEKWKMTIISFVRIFHSFSTYYEQLSIKRLPRSSCQKCETIACIHSKFTLMQRIFLRAHESGAFPIQEVLR